MFYTEDMKIRNFIKKIRKEQHKIQYVLGWMRLRLIKKYIYKLTKKEFELINKLDNSAKLADSSKKSTWIKVSTSLITPRLKKVLVDYYHFRVKKEINGQNRVIVENGMKYYMIQKKRTIELSETEKEILDWIIYKYIISRKRIVLVFANLLNQKIKLALKYYNLMIVKANLNGVKYAAIIAKKDI